MKVLHITNWYYSRKDPYKVPFIKEHFEALQNYCENKIIHVEVVSNEMCLYKVSRYRINKKEEAYIISSSLAKIWRIKELLSSQLLQKVLRINLSKDNYDIINIHTAYPLCSNIKALLKSIKIPLVYTEHWTAFHFNFNLPKETAKLNHIKNIYRHGIPVITVSKALGRDIRIFAKTNKFTNYVVHNVVNSNIFKYKKSKLPKHPQFFMLNYWREIKSPFIIFEAFKQFLETYSNATLRVGGYGPLWNDMSNYIKKYKLEKSIILLGYLEKKQAAKEMQQSSAFIHASSYETFSVVTAEALMCGTPVIVTNLPAITEFVNISNGILVENKIDQWNNALKKITTNNYAYNRIDISNITSEKFSKLSVGKKYFNALMKVKTDHSNNTETQISPALK